MRQTDRVFTGLIPKRCYTLKLRTTQKTFSQELGSVSPAVTKCRYIAVVELLASPFTTAKDRR